jgi:hypothetical protein
MNVHKQRLAIVLFIAIVGLPGRVVIAAPIDDLQAGFTSPPDDARIMMRWWWFGPTVEKSQLEREMRLMKEGHRWFRGAAGLPAVARRVDGQKDVAVSVG